MATEFTLQLILPVKTPNIEFVSFDFIDNAMYKIKT